MSVDLGSPIFVTSSADMLSRIGIGLVLLRGASPDIESGRAAGVLELLLLLSLLEPVLRYESVASPVVSDCRLEPVFWEVGMVADDDLQIWGEFSRDVPHQLEQSPYRGSIIVVAGDSAALFNFRRVVGLGGLVEHEQVRHRPVLPYEEAMEGEVGDQVVADPVFGAPDAEQRCWAGVSVSDDGQPTEIQPDVTAAVFEVKLVGPARHVVGNGQQARRELLSFLIWVELGGKALDSAFSELPANTKIRELTFVAGPANAAEVQIDSALGEGLGFREPSRLVEGVVSRAQASERVLCGA